MVTQNTLPQLTKSRVGWMLMATFALGITLLASTIRVPQVAIVLKLELDEVGFQFNDDWNIYDLSLSELSVTNLRRVELIGNVTSPSDNPGSVGRPKNLAIVSRPGVSAWSAWLSSDYLQMNLTVPANAETRLSLVRDGVSSLQIKIDGVETFASLDIGEQLHLRCSACLMMEDDVELSPARESSWRLRPARRNVSLFGANVPLMLTLRVKDSNPGTVTQLVTDSGLRALSIDFQRADAGAGAPVSAISGPGTIAFPGLETEPVALEPGDFLYISVAEPLEVRRISLTDTIQVELRGTVRDLAVGPSGALRSKKPTLLQYIYWNTWLQMVLGATLTFGAAISSLLYRFGILTKT